MHKLILILGTGQGVLEKKLGQEYRTADYYFENKPETIITTPFIGEAIIIANKSSYDEVYLLGTKDSMWSTLYARAIAENPTGKEFKIFEDLVDAINNGTIINNGTLLQNVAERLSVQYDVNTRCKLIPVGAGENEQWEIFDRIINIPQNGDTLSIDITHGLRYQPMILTLALFYMQSMLNVKIENVFYGALELSRKYYNGKTPIMNLNSLVKMISWTNAAFSFSRYGDTSVFNTVMNKEKNPDFLKRAEYFNNVLQLNTVTNIRTNADKFVRAVCDMETNENDHKAFNFVKKSIMEFPKQITETNSKCDLMLLLAEKHWKNQQYGLAILSAWEAMIERIADIYNVDVRNSFDNYKKVSQIVRNNKAFGKIGRKIGKFRNSIAHAETEKSDDPNLIVSDFSYWFGELKAKINEPLLNRLPEEIKLK